MLNFVDLFYLLQIGEPIVEPEVDLSNFLERQRLTEDDLPPIPGAIKDDDDDEDVDTTVPRMYPSHDQAMSKKGKVKQIIWDEELDKMEQDKKAAEAAWGELRLFRSFW